MATETVAVLISFAVLVLQIYQVSRYVKLETEVKRVTAELDQTLDRLHRTLEITRKIYVSLIRYYRFFGPLLNQINQEGPKSFWKDQAKYEHASAEAEQMATLNGYMIELRAITNAFGNEELKQLVERLNTWIVNPDQHAQTQLDEFHKLVGEVQEKIYHLIDERLSSSKIRM